MTRFRPYPSYKDSGVEWLGKIPERWEVKRLRRLLRGGNEGMRIGPFGSELTLASLAEVGYKVYGQENVISGDFGAGARYIDSGRYQELKAYALRGGDIILSMMGTGGRCRVVPARIDEGIMDSHLLRMRLRDEAGVAEFVASVVDEAPYVEHEVNLAGKGTIMQGLNSAIVKDLTLLLPPAPEQRVIAAFLDWETKRIDALVEKKERLVELLQEKRTALISHAVTKGLDPKVRLKDSGVEWLGKIPEHWEYSRVGHLILSTNAGEVIDKSYWHDGDELLFTCQKTPVRSWFSPFPDWKRTKTGDVLLTRNGTPYAFLPPADAIYTNVVQRVRLHQRCRPEFAFLVLNQAADTMRGFGDIIESFNMGVWRETWLPLPLADEQNRIVAFVDRETQRIDAMVEKVQSSIELLKEYRTALISAAVTGKIDVRKECS